MINHVVKSAQGMQDQINSLATQVNALASKVAQMSHPPVVSGACLDSLPPLAENAAAQELLARPKRWATDGKDPRVVARVHTIESKHTTGLAVTVMATAVIEGLVRPGDDLYAVPVDQSKRIEELEKALAGMLFCFDDGVGREYSAQLLDYARTLVAAEEFNA